MKNTQSMKKLICGLVITLAFVSCKKEENPAPEKTRFKDPVFENVTVNTVVYSTTNNLQMDIYEPANDNSTNRPVVILAHDGAFVSGSKNNALMVTLATNLAKHGYVVANFNYRLAPNIMLLLDSTFTADLVFKALGDARAAIRYFRQSASNGNPYGINTDKIFMGGNSAGAVLALHVGVLDATDQVQPHLDSIITANGGFAGNSGNPGFSSEVSGVFSMAGGLSRLSFIDANDAPLLLFHGVDDNVVPYNCGPVFSGFIQNPGVIWLCGSKPVQLQAESVGLKSTLYTYPGLHVPWQDDNTGEPLPLYYEMQPKIIDFLFGLL